MYFLSLFDLWIKKQIVNLTTEYMVAARYEPGMNFLFMGKISQLFQV